MSRRDLIRGLGAALSMALAGCTSIPETHRVAASDLAREHGSVDLHAHPGMFRSSPLTMESQVERMGRGHVKTVLFAAVADGPLIGRRPSGGLYATREPTPGSCPPRRGGRSIRCARVFATGALKVVSGPSDMDAVLRGGGTGAMLAAEGGDFLEGKIARVEEAHQRGLRSIQLVHYRVNELGDIQTEPPDTAASRRSGRT
jgi:membrane dipeptidase